MNELQKRWCEISDGWNVLKYHCNLKFARFPPERAHLFRYTFDCCSCDLRQDEDDAGPQSYKQKQEGKPGSDMFWPGVAMCSLKITWERLIIIHTGMPMAWPQMKIISKTIWSFNLWQSRDAPNLYWFFWVMSCFPFFNDFSSILTSETAFPLLSIHQLPPRPKRPGCSSKFTSTTGTHCAWQEGKLGAPKLWQVLSESRFLLPIDFVITLRMQGVLFQIGVHSKHDGLENDFRSNYGDF